MVNNEIELEIDKLCRCCMCENENMHNMFEDKSTNEIDSVGLSEMLKICAAVEVDLADNLPNNLCGSCEEKLKSFYQFRKQCQQTDVVLRELTRTESKKIEDDQGRIVNSLTNISDDLFDEEDDLPLLARKDIKRKRGRPKKIESETDNDRFVCTLCNKVLNSKKGLKIHLKVHTKDTLKQCLFCEATYSRSNHLIRHISTHDKPGLRHACDKCNELFDAAAELYKHSQTHQENQVVEQNNIKIEISEVKSENNEHPPNETQDHLKSISGDKLAIIPKDNFFFEISNSDGEDNDNYQANSDDEYGVVDGKNEEKEKEKRNRKAIEEDDSKMSYECKNCSKTMTTLLGYKIHMRKHTGTDLATCKLCNKSFTKQSHLTRHIKTHGISDEEQLKELRNRSEDKCKRVMECDYCDRKFKYKKSFLHHMQSEHGMSDAESDIVKTEEEKKNNDENEIGEDDEFYKMHDTLDNNIKDEGQNSSTDDKMASELMMEADSENIVSKRSRVTKSQICHVCGASFARVNHLTRHMILHRSVLIHQCDRCDKAFASEDFLKEHVKEEHINKPYVCTVCNKPFGRGEHLIRHLKVHQSGGVPENEVNLKCSICDLTFTRSDHLARHTKIHLLQDKRHFCTDCGKAFNRLDNLKTHQRIHTGIKDTSKLHLCIYCGKEFNNSSNMIVHMRRHTGERPYKCNECGKGFPRSHDLKCHERTHSGEKPYLCTLCGKSFNKSNKLLRHSRVHTGERPYVCNICGRAFTQSNDLALHMRRHTGARPYACGVCPARFIQSGQLKTHRRTTGHWMETQPDLKGGHRVEPVTPAHEPMPIRFKSHRMKKENEPVVDNYNNKVEEPAQITQEQQQLQSTVEEQQQEPTPIVMDIQPPRILMGIMSNIKLQNEVSPLLIDGTKLVELHQAALVNLPTVIQTSNGEEIKLKSEVSGFTITPEVLGKQDDDANNSSYQDATTVIYSSVEHTSTTYTSSEAFNFQNYH